MVSEFLARVYGREVEEDEAAAQCLHLTATPSSDDGLGCSFY